MLDAKEIFNNDSGKNEEPLEFNKARGSFGTGNQERDLLGILDSTARLRCQVQGGRILGREGQGCGCSGIPILVHASLCFREDIMSKFGPPFSIAYI